eukprot:13461124-Heterocapsa_arctica.AAC.1
MVMITIGEAIHNSGGIASLGELRTCGDKPDKDMMRVLMKEYSGQFEEQKKDNMELDKKPCKAVLNGRLEQSSLD